MNHDNELRIDTRIRNNRLYRLIFDNYPSVLKFCEALGVHPVEVGAYLNLKKSPILKNGYGYRRTCRRIADHFFLPVEEIFPIELYQLKEHELSLEMRIEHLPFHECTELEGGDDPNVEAEISELRERIEEVLSTLNPRYAKILRMRFGLEGSNGEETLDEVAGEFQVTKERIRQMEAKALRKLRHPSRSRKLKDFF